MKKRKWMHGCIFNWCDLYKCGNRAQRHVCICIQLELFIPAWSWKIITFLLLLFLDLKLENYYFLRLPETRPEVRKLLLFYLFTFSRPEVENYYFFAFLLLTWPENYYFFTFLFYRPEVENYYIFTILLFLDLQDRSNSSELAMGLLQSYTKPSKYGIFLNLRLRKSNQKYSREKVKNQIGNDGFVQDCKMPLLMSLENTAVCSLEKK